MKIGKYKFNDKESADSRIGSLNINHNHTIVHLGNILIKECIINSEGEIIEEAQFSDKWHVDVLWIDLPLNTEGNISHPYGWAGKSIQVDHFGVHRFFGLNYNALKF